MQDDGVIYGNRSKVRLEKNEIILLNRANQLFALYLSSALVYDGSLKALALQNEIGNGWE